MKKNVTFFKVFGTMLLTFLFSTVQAQTWGSIDERLMPVSHNLVNGIFVANPSSHVIVQDDVMYFTDYYGLYVYNVSNHSSPIEIGNTPVPGIATHFTISGNHAYVCVDYGIAIINISDPQLPQVVSVEYFDYKPYKIIVDSSHAFVAGNEGLRSYLLEAPDEMELLDYLYISPANFLSAGIEKYDAHIYFVNQTNLRVINASDPKNLTSVSNISLSPGGSCWGNLALKDNYLLVVSTQALRIFDLTDPASPNLLYSDRPVNHSMYDIVVENNYAVVNHNSNQRWTILDISNPSSPLALYENTDPMMHGLYSLGALKNNILYILDNGQENFEGYTMHLVDISVPLAPVKVSEIESEPGRTRAVSLFEKDGNSYALVAQNHSMGSGIGVGSLRILDISDPAAPQLISELELPNITIAVEAGTEEHAFVLMANYSFPNYNYRLALINIENINNPFIQNIQPDGISLTYLFNNSLSYFNGNIFVVSRTHLHIYNVVAGSLVLKGSTTIYGQSGVAGFTNNSDYYYVAGGGSGFQLYNVANPATPFLVNFNNTTAACWDVYVKDGFGYVADYDGSLAIFDVSQNFIQPVTQTPAIGNAISIKVFDEVAYVGTEDGRIEMFDVSTQSQPVSLGWYLTNSNRVNNMAIDNESSQLYVANELELLVLQLETDPTGAFEAQRMGIKGGFYPNPANRIANFEFAIPQKTWVNISAYDMNGKLVHTIINEVLGQGKQRLQWETGNIPNGVYNIQIRIGQSMITEKLIIQK